MSAKAVYEANGKKILGHALPHGTIVTPLCATVTPTTDWQQLLRENPWLNEKKLVAKPDQLIKRRGKLGLVKVNVDAAQAQEWIASKMNTELAIGSAKGVLNHFVIEPFVAHEQQDEHYICIYAQRDCNTVLFYHEGGVDVGDVDAKASTLDVDVLDDISEADIVSKLLVHIAPERQPVLVKFISNIYKAFKDLYFTYLEINPLVVVGEDVYMLDLAAKLDQTAEYLCHEQWGKISFPPPFGRAMIKEEAYIAELDSKSGASLKLTILNITGRIWTMVAGGGASVIYSDTICDLGGASELANYGEYSGAPSEEQTYEYAKTMLSLMAQTQDPRGKVLIIGGGIANFTNVAATFKGIVRALEQYQHILHSHKISIYVRRGGPNYQEGLRLMHDLGTSLGVPIHVYGPETHMTAIVSMALGLRDTVPSPAAEAGFIDNIVSRQASASSPASTRNTNIQQGLASPSAGRSTSIGGAGVSAAGAGAGGDATKIGDVSWFSKRTRAFLYGVHPQAVQGMLDFDYCCGRDQPSVAAMIYPFSGNHKQRFYWGTKEIMVPVYEQMAEAMTRHPDVDVMVNFASLRSAFDATMETLKYPQINVIAIIAEGIPENKTRELIVHAHRLGKHIIGPATVGGIKPGCFKIGNTGGSIDNIIASRLYRPGSVAYVSRSGGMSNELNNIVARNANGVYEGVAIGGDRYPGTTFMDHLMRFQNDSEVKLMVLLGELGGVEEYAVCEALQSGKITKPVVAWCIGTCARMFTSEVQFGHAGACANAERETAFAKNAALKAAGAVVPQSFDSLGDSIKDTYNSLVAKGVIVVQAEPPVPRVPIDYKWAQELGLIRKPANFVSSVSDDRGEELCYAGMPITDVFKDDIGIGGVISLLWFQRRLPAYACKFIEMCLMITADHGPAVSGAHNTIVTARAGKDLVSSVCAGLLTIGDRFGGALDGAARQLSLAYDGGASPREFVSDMRRKNQLIMGIGHRIKSIQNPDMRVSIIKSFAHKHFPRTRLLDYAIEVEKITTAKKPNLILNVDGAIAAAFVDLLRECGAFTTEEADEYIEMGCLNGLFVLGRTTGFIGHFIDQKRLKQGLYRHPWDDIVYLSNKPDEPQSQ